MSVFLGERKERGIGMNSAVRVVCGHALSHTVSRTDSKGNEWKSKWVPAVKTVAMGAHSRHTLGEMKPGFCKVHLKPVTPKICIIFI